MKDLNLILQILVGIGALLGGAGYGYGQFRKGRKSVDDETISSYQKNQEVLESRIDIMEKRQTELEHENKVLRDMNSKLQGKVESYEKLLTLQSPSIDKLTELILQTSNNVNKLLDCTVKK